MSFREFLDSAEDKWAWYRTFALLCVIAVSVMGYFGYRVAESYEIPELDGGVAEEKIERASDVPNGGLIVEKSQLDFGVIWESDQRLSRQLTLKNPWDHDLHIELDQSLCGYEVWPDEFVVPALGTFEVTIGIQPSTRSPASREFMLNSERPFSVRITEFPGSHPGWTVRAQILRAMAIDEVADDRTYRVVPLHPLEGITADFDGDSSGISIDGPDHRGCFLVKVDRTGVPTEQKGSLWIRANVDGLHTSERYVW